MLKIDQVFAFYLNAHRVFFILRKIQTIHPKLSGFLFFQKTVKFID
jgi:hypothetical protein